MPDPTPAPRPCPLADCPSWTYECPACGARINYANPDADHPSPERCRALNPTEAS